MPRRTIPRLPAAIAAVILLPLAAATPTAAAGNIIHVTTTDQEVNDDADCSLQEAIYAANLDDIFAPDPANPLDPNDLLATGCTAGNGADIIELPPMSVFTFSDAIDDYDNYMGPSATPVITSAIVIEGRGAQIERNRGGRLTRAFVVGPGGDLDLREVHVKGFGIHGGNGADGGGGGMGAGGAIYVTEGQLRVQWSTFEGNTATGGDGSFLDHFAGGGGGGLSGDGGDADEYDHALGSDGGGGGGSRGDGAAANAGGSGGGRVTSAAVTPGKPCGGAGATTGGLSGAEAGEDAPCDGGGGGGGEGRSIPIVDWFCGGNGGEGAYGGGGGGGGVDSDGGDGGFGGGGGGGGGDGGFGGGGGAAGFNCFGGGRGQGGTFAGDGGEPFGDGGGGGAGLGGAIFGDRATINISNSTFADNSAVRGRNGGGDSRDGRGAGGAVFLVGGVLRIDSSTFSGNEAVTVTGGGGGAIVVYDPIGDVEASLRLRNTLVAGNGASECYTRNGVATTGSTHNVITDSTPNNLSDPACPGVLSTTDPGLGPLTMNPPGRTPTMAIGSTSSALDAGEPTAAPPDDQRGILRPQGAGPDIGAYEFSGVAPKTTITLSPASPDGQHGWYVGSVGVSVTATDADSTVAQTRCALDPSTPPTTFGDLPDATCSLSSVGADGTHAIHAASIDMEGNVEAPVVGAAVKVDQTDPTLAPTLSATTIQLGQTGVTASPHADDPTSHVASSSCDAVTTATPGDHTVTCHATDNAGNTASATIHYVVAYRMLGFFSPVPASKWHVGQAVPIKIALADAAGTRISDAAAAPLATGCRVKFSAAGAQASGPTCMTYDAANDQFALNWKLGKKPLGNATITVTISYPGTTSTTRLTEPIVITK